MNLEGLELSKKIPYGEKLLSRPRTLELGSQKGPIQTNADH